MMTMLKILLGLALLTTVSACGKKGDVKPPSRGAHISAVFVLF